jgi:glycosyltransferase involved in cell wall biosynthesis
MTDAPSPRVLLHVFPTFDIGGSQMRFATLANRLAGRYRHEVLAMDNRQGARVLLEPSVDFAIREFDLDKRRTLANLRHYRRFIRDLRAGQLFTYNWGATEWGLANLLGGIPHVHVEDGFGPEETTRQLPRRVWFRRLALARARPIVLPSRKLYRIARDIWRFPASRLAYIPNGVDCRRFDRRPDADLCARLGLDRRRPVIGTVAGLRPEKNVGRLIRAFARLRATHDAVLVLVGSGSEESALRQLARDLRIADHVVFAGQLTGVERILGAFDVYAISSDTEQMPISLVEAMAAGLPVASVDVGDAAIMLAPENRPFVSPLDDAALAVSMARLLADPALRTRIGAANAARARTEYDEAAMVAAYDALFAGEYRSRPRH